MNTYPIVDPDTLAYDIETHRDAAAALWDNAADEKSKRYLEGRRDAYDDVLWRIRNGKWD